MQRLSIYVNMKNMRLYFYIAIFILCGSAIFLPGFAFAKECYVDQDLVGEKIIPKNSYVSILKALEKSCSEIEVANGVYQEDLVLKKEVILRGESREASVIKGGVTMETGSRIEHITIDSHGGILIPVGVSAEIDNVRILNAKIGVEMMGSGKFKMIDSDIALGGKGLYIRKGGNIDISSSKVYKNDEEGIDIRSEVDGNITNNKIYANGESGIEVVLGDSQLNIINNTIDKNGSSGIAAQYYTSANKFGRVVINKNEMNENFNHGLTCKAPSGSEGKPSDYWEKSMKLAYNTILENEIKEIASNCGFDDTIKNDAVKSQREREAEISTLEERANQRGLSANSKKRLEKLQEDREDALAKKVEEEKLQKEIDDLLGDLKSLIVENDKKKNLVNNRSNWKVKIIGPNYKEIKNIVDNFDAYNEKMRSVKDKRVYITDNDFLDKINEKIALFNSNKRETKSFIEIQKEKKSWFGELFKKKYSI